MFGFWKKNKANKFRITESDRNWVESNFKWLLNAYGYPSKHIKQVSLSPDYFPKSFSTNDFCIDNAFDDLCKLFDIDKVKVTFELHNDLYAISGMPLETEGKPFETELEIYDSIYRLHVAKSLLKRPNKLIYCLVYEFIKIRLTENKLQYDTGEDTGLFIFIAGTYFGFGVLLSRNLIDRGRVDDGFWETKWNYVSEMPTELMAFSLAIFAQLTGQNEPIWKNELSNDLRLYFEGAMSYIVNSPSGYLDENELEASNWFNQANQEYVNNDFGAAIISLKKVLSLTKDELLIADAYNNIGYYNLRKGEFEESIPHFLKALEVDPGYGFAHDNLGYALIRTGRLDEGKRHLELATKSTNNNPAYSHRNMALYYIANGEWEKARRRFQKAFEVTTGTVDLLELHYAEFLLCRGDMEQGLIYLKMAVDKGEPESIDRMRQLNPDKGAM